MHYNSAQGITADASIAVLREDTSRNLLYVALTRGRQANHAYVYERSSEASEFGRELRAETHTAQRGDIGEAATLLHRILANGEPAITANDYAAQIEGEALPDRVRDLLDMRAAAEHRQESYEAWKAQRQELDRGRPDSRTRTEVKTVAPATGSNSDLTLAARGHIWSKWAQAAELPDGERRLQQPVRVAVPVRATAPWV